MSSDSARSNSENRSTRGLLRQQVVQSVPSLEKPGSVAQCALHHGALALVRNPGFLCWHHLTDLPADFRCPRYIPEHRNDFLTDGSNVR
jgi:hypothetical protein